LTKEADFIVKPVDTDAYCLWKEGVFYFDNVSLIEITKELGRWYNVDVVFNNHKAMGVNMHFLAERNGSIQQVVDLLNSLNKAKVAFVNNQLIID
jgi:transmembrane sensor